MTQTTNQPDFVSLLKSATDTPGIVSAAYSAFHNYSFGNQLLAHAQIVERGLPLGPIGSFMRWKELGRYVRKGEKAIELCMPVTCKRPAEPDHGEEQDVTFTRFVFRRNWFTLAQTEGAEYQPAPPAEWNQALALETLQVNVIPFDLMDGNCQGFARARSIAVSPLAALPLKTTFHELAHVLIGHTSEGELSDSDRTPKCIRELEAEATAMLCCAALGLPGVDECRGYIQSWFGAGEAIPESSARRIFKTADSILKAGRPAEMRTAE